MYLKSQQSEIARNSYISFSAGVLFLYPYYISGPLKYSTWGLIWFEKISRIVIHTLFSLIIIIIINFIKTSRLEFGKF